MDPNASGAADPVDKRLVTLYQTRHRNLFPGTERVVQVLFDAKGNHPDGGVCVAVVPDMVTAQRVATTLYPGVRQVEGG